MGTDVFFKRVEMINELIQKQETGTPDQLAKTLNITARTLYSYIKFMREYLNAPIHYDPSKKSYVYTEKGELSFNFYPNKEAGVKKTS